MSRYGPADATRELGEVPGVLAAVHDACDTMTRIATVGRRQVRALTGARKILAAARPDPAALDMLGPLAPARIDRIGALLTLCKYAGQQPPKRPPLYPPPRPLPGYRAAPDSLPSASGSTLTQAVRARGCRGTRGSRNRLTNPAGSSEHCAASASPAPTSFAAQKTSTAPPNS